MANIDRSICWCQNYWWIPCESILHWFHIKTEPDYAKNLLCPIATGTHYYNYIALPSYFCMMIRLIHSQIGWTVCLRNGSCLRFSDSWTQTFWLWTVYPVFETTGSDKHRFVIKQIFQDKVCISPIYVFRFVKSAKRWQTSSHVRYHLLTLRNWSISSFQIQCR